MNNTEGQSFMDDGDKMVDFFQLTKSDFLKSYSYLEEKDYDATFDDISFVINSRINRKGDNMRGKQDNTNIVMAKILAELVITQGQTSPIHLSIGYTSEDNMVRRNTLVIKDAAPMVLKRIMELAEEYKLIVSIGLSGVIISFDTCKEIPIDIAVFKN